MKQLLFAIALLFSLSIDANDVNIAPICSSKAASYTASWNNLNAINDGTVGFGELSNTQTWGCWQTSRPASNTLTYNWGNMYSISSVKVWFWTDSETAGDNVCVPASWTVQYYDDATTSWKNVTLKSGQSYKTSKSAVNTVSFNTVRTHRLRLNMNSQKGTSTYSAVGVTEWEVYADDSDIPVGTDETNVALRASNVSASYTASWNSVYAIYDGITGFGELANENCWGCWQEDRTQSSWVEYDWDLAYTVDSVCIWWWSNTTTPGANVAVPASWKIQYYDENSSSWKAVTLADGEVYATERLAPNGVRFNEVTTKKLRVLMFAQKGTSTYSAVGISEFEVYGESSKLPTITYGDYPISNVTFDKVHFNDSFWLPRIKQNQTATIPVALKQCWDTGRVDNFLKATAILQGKNIGYFATENTFDDTDIYKIIEGISYSLQTMSNAALEKEMDSLITIIGNAQEPDGYLYTARTAGDPNNLHSWVGPNRWEYDPNLSHELYCCGHLYEAAVANYISTGKKALLNIAIKNADLLVKDFLEGGLCYEPGHQIVEMGLVKMYRVTGNQKYLELAKYFLDLRGNRGVMRQEYSQTHKPVVEQDEAVGHAVRAAYMYSGMADVAAIMNNNAYLNAIDKIWENVVTKKYYLNGGIGATSNGEAFGANYYLPNESAYCETCASIANVYWNWRMFLLHGESKYYDVIERTLYNGVLSGIGLDGKTFFYPNKLESYGGYARSEWFGCACCPSNLCRFMASIPGYVYAEKGDSVYVNLYVQSNAELSLNGNPIELTQTTQYPWQGGVVITVDKTMTSPFTMMLRLPGWAKNEPVPSDLYSYINNSEGSVTLKINGEEVQYELVNGYMVCTRTWNVGDKIEIEFPMDVHQVEANKNVEADEGLTAFERGPIVYCMESVDNKNYSSVAALAGAKAEAKWSDDLNGIMEVDVTSSSKSYDDKAGKMSIVESPVRLIPYYAWDNRGTDMMKIWLPSTATTDITTIGSLTNTDTIHVDVWQESNSSTAKIYPNETYTVPVDYISKYFGITEDKFAEEFGNSIRLGAVEPDGTLNYVSTANDPGHWFGADGYTLSWGTDARMFSEMDVASFVLKIGQFPGRCSDGETYSWKQAFTYAPTEDGATPKRVVLAFTLHIGYDESNSLNLENQRVQQYMSDVEYTRDASSKISLYTTDSPFRKDQPRGITLKWTPTAGITSQRLYYSDNPNMENKTTVIVTRTSTENTIYNLIPGKTYYYRIEGKVNGDTILTDSGHFVPEGQVRMLKIDGLSNIRDIGGWMTTSGHKIKYGKLFRGVDLNNKHTPTSSDKALLRKAGILAELDLRMDSEASSITASPLGATINYLRCTTYEYNLYDYKPQYKQIFEYILDNLRNGKPVYIHCIWGFDRTGTLAFLLEGLLGVGVSDLYKDYELSQFSNDALDVRPKSNLDGVYDVIQKQSGSKLIDKFNSYFLSTGVSQADIDEFRTLMIDYTDEDINCDGSVDSQDVLKVYDYMKTSTASPNSATREDVNSDGTVDSQDVLKIYDYMKGS